ncbi:hypothetical protein ABGB12_33955 [Actinocorallia sp. B10E7]|uniref:hypothetical protein n=1 Tax=Actinocorallia sp. B10E7 TaxID=3153558 RepID=UPI00325E781A
MLYALIFFAALAILGPLLGRDSRDARDWSLVPQDEPRRHASGGQALPGAGRMQP